MKKEKLSVKMSLPYGEAISYMEDLLNSLKSGNIVVKSDDDFVTLVPSATVEIEVKAKDKKGKQHFGFELSWKEGKSGDFSISDKEPAIPAPPVEKRVPATREASEIATKTPAKPPAKKPAKKAAKATGKKSSAKQSVSKNANK